MSNLHIPLSLPSKHGYFASGFNSKRHSSPPDNSKTSKTTNNSNNQANNNNNRQPTMYKAPPQKSNTFPLNFNGPPTSTQNTLGQFSPSIFTTRRVWVKKAQGTPTTIILHQNDIIDDLKQAVVNKFPNSLAREIDPADLIIKMDLQARQLDNAAVTQNTPNNKKTTYSNNSIVLTSPDNSKSIKSPVSLGTQTLQQANPNTYINLEPDQNVWNLLDTYYPHGMSMPEAFIIETPDVEVPSNRSSFNAGYGNNYSHRMSSSQAQPLPIRSMNASQILNSNQTYHQPKPQYMYQSNPIAQNLSTIHDKSVSPVTARNDKQSPLPYGANIHRRSQSNPLQSPSSSSASIPTNNSNENSQAVLLLPKNFSLATGVNSNSNNTFNNKKRLSLDENLVQKNRDESPLESPDGSSANMTNIGLGIHNQSHSVPEAYELASKDRNGNNNTKDKSANIEGSTNTNTTTDERDRLSISPSPPIDDLASSKRNNMNLDQILSGDNDINQRSIKLKGIEATESFKSSDCNEGKKKPNSASTQSVKVAKLTTDTVLPSISVLVVEDNAINQAILGAFLRKYKIRYQIAKNGQEAVDKWRTGGFHLVLMDIQLPVKSGIEATKEIRHLEKINKIGVFAQHELSSTSRTNPSELKEDDKLNLTVFRSPVIIVALTASSNSSVDRKNALRAGCNDYLTKPVNLVWLQNKITEWGCMQTLIDFDGWKAKRSVDRFVLNINKASGNLK